MLGRALSVEWMPRIIFLETAICVAGNLSVYIWGGAIPASAYKQGIGVVFTQPVIILHVSFRTISTYPVCLERSHEEIEYNNSLLQNTSMRVKINDVMRGLRINQPIAKIPRNHKTIWNNIGRRY